jgi:hypothetical protein
VVVPDPGGPGRPPEYCRRSHRQRAYEARRLAARHRLGSEDVLVSRSTWEAIRDAVYRVEAALEDVDHDLAGADDVDHREVLWHLYRSAADLRRLSLEPRALGR